MRDQEEGRRQDCDLRSAGRNPKSMSSGLRLAKLNEPKIPQHYSTLQIWDSMYADDHPREATDQDPNIY